MLNKMLKLLLIPILILSGCAQDIGLRYDVVEEVQIIGDVVVQTRDVYDQALDILFLIDRSCSMYDDAQTLQNAMPTIHQELLSPEFTDLDWRLAVKSTDPNEGVLEAWVEWDDPNVEFKLSAIVNESSDLFSLGGEAGLDSAIDSLAWDEDFHREQSDTLIVFMSDEVDQSGITVSNYQSMVDSYKGFPFVVTEGAIVPTRLGTTESPRCDSATELGEGYLDVSETVVDLCDTADWITVLDFVKEHVPTLNRVWPLEYQPLTVDSIVVEVDGVEWNHWHYDGGDNAVYMDVIPQTGSNVVIAYLAP